MAVYNIHTLPIEIKDVLRRKKEGEEFVLKDSRINGPFIPVIFDELDDNDIPTSYRYLPMAYTTHCDLQLLRLPPYAIVVPFTLLRQVSGEYVTDDVIRLMIAHEYGHFVINDGFYNPYRSRSFLEKLKVFFCLLPEIEPCELEADHYAIQALAPYLKNDDVVKEVYAKSLAWLKIAYYKGDAPSGCYLDHWSSGEIIEKRQKAVINRFYAEYRKAQKRKQA